MYQLNYSAEVVWRRFFVEPETRVDQKIHSFRLTALIYFNAFTLETGWTDKLINGVVGNVDTNCFPVYGRTGWCDISLRDETRVVYGFLREEQCRKLAGYTSCVTTTEARSPPSYHFQLRLCANKTPIVDTCFTNKHSLFTRSVRFFDKQETSLWCTYVVVRMCAWSMLVCAPVRNFWEEHLHL